MTSSHSASSNAEFPKIQNVPAETFGMFKPPKNIESKLEWSLALAEFGFFVFPLAENSKIPVKDSHWKEDGTRDTNKIKSWWTDSFGRNLNLNIGILAWRFRSAALLVVDLDVKNGKNGIQEFINLANQHGGIVSTFTVLTPSGGLHLYYLCSEPLRTVHKKEGIDFQSKDAYVVGPGSEINGKSYRIINELYC